MLRCGLVGIREVSDPYLHVMKVCVLGVFIFMADFKNF